jgi:hypothetical protein
MTPAEQKIIAGLVRPLMWETTPAVPDYWRARVEGVGAYEIYMLGDEQFALDRMDVRGGVIVGRFPTLAAAQASAEADYRARIAAALDLDKLTALVEAGSYMLNHAEWREQNDGVFWEASNLMRAALSAFQGEPT